MTMFELRRRWPVFLSPGVSLGAALSAILLVACSPWAIKSMRSALGAALSPGQHVADAGRREASHLFTRWRDVPSTIDHLAGARAEIEGLRRRNQQLEAQLDSARHDEKNRFSAGGPAPVQSPPLLVPELIEARLLGRQARSFLARQDIIDSGAADGVQPHALVLLAAPLLDEGRDARLSAGDLVLAGRRIVGRVAEVGKWTSTVLRVAEPGYRDLVRLVPTDQSPAAFSPQGVLEGTGDGECRIRHISITAAVSVGDVVYTAADDGILPRPLVYGTVTRVKAAADNAHWDIWMRPQTPIETVDGVAVVRTRLNPQRMVRKTP